MKIAVVLPALNEAAHLQRTCSSLVAQTRTLDRLVIVDGGSRDGTVEIARQFANDLLVVPGRGRGGQIAAGVAVGTDDVVLVAHADMVFPPTALETIQRFLMRHPASPGGCLGHRFDNPRRVYRAIEWWDHRRALRGHSFGDQAQFFRREYIFTEHILLGLVKEDSGVAVNVLKNLDVNAGGVGLRASCNFVQHGMPCASSTCDAAELVTLTKRGAVGCPH